MIKKKFVDININVFEGIEAEKRLLQKNDTGFLSSSGIINVSQDRWLEAQQYEHKTWMIDGLNCKEDHNKSNIAQFNNMASIKDRLFGNTIELGCGPFTNVAVLEPFMKLGKITILDPLLGEYLKHPNCRYKNKPDWTKINLPIEHFDPNEKYDLLILINVLEHCRDIPIILEKVVNMLSTGGVFVFGDVCFSQEAVESISKTAYNSGHPIRITDELMYEYLNGNFSELYLKKKKVSVANHPAEEVYFVGTKKCL